MAGSSSSPAYYPNHNHKDFICVISEHIESTSDLPFATISLFLAEHQVKLYPATADGKKNFKKIEKSPWTHKKGSFDLSYLQSPSTALEAVTGLVGELKHNCWTHIYKLAGLVYRAANVAAAKGNTDLKLRVKFEIHNIYWYNEELPNDGALKDYCAGLAKASESCSSPDREDKFTWGSWCTPEACELCLQNFSFSNGEKIGVMGCGHVGHSVCFTRSKTICSCLDLSYMDDTDF